jgi:hypothetical protein
MGATASVVNASARTNKLLAELTEKDVSSVLVCLKMEKFIDAFHENQV